MRSRPARKPDLQGSGVAHRLPSGRWQLRYYDADGNRRQAARFRREALRAALPRRNRAPPAWQRATGATGLEPATSGVTGRRSNQLNYAPEPSHCSLPGMNRTRGRKSTAQHIAWVHVPGEDEVPEEVRTLWDRPRRARVRPERSAHLGAAAGAPAALAQAHGRAAQGRVRPHRGGA